MQSRHRGNVEQLQERITKIIQMRVDHVELVGAPRHRFQFHEHRREIILHAGIETQRARPDRREFRFRQTVAGGKQRHLVPKFHQCIGQIGDDTLGAAVVFRRHGFGEWGNLRNLHDESPWRYGETHILTRQNRFSSNAHACDLVERIVAIRL